MNYFTRSKLVEWVFGGITASLIACVSSLALAQDSVEWLTLGSDYAHTRYLGVDEITPENFKELEEAWIWDGASFNAASGRSTPSYVDGKIITVAGPRRYVIAIDAKSGEMRPSGLMSSRRLLATNIPCAKITVRASPSPRSTAARWST